MNADMQNFAFSPLLLGQKRGVGTKQEGITGVEPSIDQSMAEIPITKSRPTLKLCKYPESRRNRVILRPFQNIQTA
jgi:hypothetical protein